MKKTVSIPQDMEDFLFENPDISPSKLLQSKIIEIREQKRLSTTMVNNLKRKINYMAKLLDDKCRECDRLGDELVKKNANIRIPGTQKRLREFKNPI